MKRPDLTFTWRGIEFEWSPAANAYIADTAQGRWMAQRHANDEHQWCGRFLRQTSGWFEQPSAALDDVRTKSIVGFQELVHYLKELRP